MSFLTQEQASVATKPLVIIFLGPPGAGKGTHAGPLSQALGIPHISTGDLFRDHIRRQTDLGKQAKQLMDNGNLVPDELVFDMLFERIERKDCEKGFILDGFPRTLAQALSFDAYFEDDALIFYFHVSDEILIERITGRMSCKQCGKPYHRRFDPPKVEGMCDVCSIPLHQREDDREDIVRKRLEVYKDLTKPVVDHYSKQLIEIDASQSKSDIYNQINTLISTHR